MRIDKSGRRPRHRSPQEAPDRRVPFSPVVSGPLQGPRRPEQPAELASKARSIADDVNHVCGETRCIGSLSLAVLMLAEAVEELAERRCDDILGT